MINSRKIEDLKPEAQVKCKEFIQKCTDAGFNIKIVQTKRDSEYQAFLYAQGRTAPGKIVTKADGVKNKSRHQSGEAWDAVVLNPDGSIDWETADKYKQLADIAVAMGLTAGYYFSFRDMDHFELK